VRPGQGVARPPLHAPAGDPVSLSIEVRRLRGRRVRKVLLRAFPDGHGGNAYNPLILFDDGSALAFSVTELEHGDGYGVTPIVVPAPRGGP